MTKIPRTTLENHGLLPYRLVTFPMDWLLIENHLEGLLSGNVSQLALKFSPEILYGNFAWIVFGIPSEFPSEIHLEELF